MSSVAAAATLSALLRSWQPRSHPFAAAERDVDLTHFQYLSINGTTLCAVVIVHAVFSKIQNCEIRHAMMCGKTIFFI